jgi:CRP-like cAMP-binding protein
MYGKPRAATVVARTQGSLWELDRRAFRTVMHKRDPKVIMKLLQNVEVCLFHNLNESR